MRTFCICLLFLLNSYRINCQEDSLSKEESFLIIKGVLSGRAHRASPYTVELISTSATDTIHHGTSGRFSCALDCSSYYAIRISRNGYYPRLISVDTRSAGSHKTKFVFRTSLIKRAAADKNEDVHDFPIAVISFDARKKMYYYNRKYTQNIRREMLSYRP